MVLLRECDEEGNYIIPSDPVERDRLRRECTKHATGPDGFVDWEAFHLGFYGESLFSDLSSDSDSSRDSDCVIISASSGTSYREINRLELQPLELPFAELSGEESSPGLLDMGRFAEEVLVESSFYTEVAVIDCLRSKLKISSTGHEEDVVVLSCDEGERVCDQEMAGELDQSYMMYMVVLEEFGVKIPLTPFEMDVLKYLNVAPSQIHPNSWAFIRGFEIVCKAFDLEPSVAVFFHFYGTKDINKGTWIAVSAHAGKRLFPQYASNYKKRWHDTFARVQGAPECSTSSVLVDGKPKFPLRWTSDPVAVKGFDYDKMSSYEQALVCFLEKFSLLNIHELLDREGDCKRLDGFLRECFFIILLAAFVFPFSDQSWRLTVLLCHLCRKDASVDCGAEEEVFGGGRKEQKPGWLCVE